VRRSHHGLWYASVIALCLWAVAVAFAYARLNGRPRSRAAVSVAARSGRPDGWPLVTRDGLVYAGAFRLPGGSINGSSFGFGGTALAFNPSSNSLFLVGHDWHQLVAEVAIPDVRSASSLDRLATASLLQPFRDVTEGKFGSLGAEATKIGGLLPYRDKLYVSAYVFYDAAHTQVSSHLVTSTDLSVTGDAGGPYRVGTVGAGFVSGYFATIPAAWQAALGGPVLNGNCCLSIISRTSQGPAAFAIDPAQLENATPLPATPLVYYPMDHHTLGAWNETSEYFGDAQAKGVVFPEGTRSVLFFGWKGVGAFCYDTPQHACEDPAWPYKGSHAYPYKYFVWAYDANDLAAVKRGERQPWDVVPYAAWIVTLPFANGFERIQGAAYDPATNRIFVTQAGGDGDLPLVHVFTVRAG
jgi:hypothetical protein